MRIVSTDEPNVLEVYDRGDDSKMEVYYRDPTSTEHAEFATNSQFKRVGDEIVSCVGEARQNGGYAVLTGFRDGDFAEKIKGQVKPVSSNPASKGYKKDWKEWFLKYHGDLVGIVGRRAFEKAMEVQGLPVQGGPKKDAGKQPEPKNGEDTTHPN